ncbi:hypothetical protein SAMN04487967_3616 [Natronorubrum sediminis]|uniref:Uncharacterized protein n=1 Tax=Natronorubrum sediminis TaxID=640943 RepID=A0A1H6G655_9EURY|nr:hypothetical protein [Natronorubrum sediminis]SEH18090.1 hypothetical protein SAMN04487967_3616 [Natronorubrum sediminis]
MSQQKTDIESVTTSFYRKGKTDGLPVVPPTEERVDKMLEGTDLPRDDVIGRLGTREGALTVEKLAVNGVMAGCLPIHMPLLVAGARALADPKSNAIQASVSTGSWAYLFVVNGPIRRALEVNSDTAAFGPGFRTNQTVGRALGLAYKNTARIHPGEKEMATIGNPFKFSLIAGENEERSPWEPLHVERGYDRDDSTITFAAPNNFLQYKFEAGPRGDQEMVESLIRNTPPHMVGLKTETANERYEGAQLEVYYALCPYNAQELEDYTKAEIKEYISENALRRAEEVSGLGGGSARDDGLQSLWRRQFADPDRIKLFVTGGSGRFNAAMGPTLGGPTTKRVELPDDWEALLERYGDELDREWGQPSDD